MNVRALRLPDDVAELSRLDVASTAATVLDVESTPAGFTIVETPAPEPLRKDHEFLADVTGTDRAWTEGFVACEEGRVIGFAATGFSRWNRRQVLWHLYVDRAHRGRGAARALLHHVTNRALRNGARHVWLETQNTNTPAVHAYRAMGFDLVGLDRTLYDGDAAGETALYLAKPLVAYD